MGYLYTMRKDSINAMVRGNSYNGLTTETGLAYKGRGCIEMGMQQLGLEQLLTLRLGLG